MATKPDGVVPSDKMVEILNSIVKQAYADTLDELNSADFADKRHRTQLLKRIEQMAKDYQVDLDAWADVAVPTFYEEGMRNSTKAFASAGVTLQMPDKFTDSHRQIVEAITREAKENVAQGMEGLRRTSVQKITEGAQDAVAKRLAVGAVKGEGVERIQEKIETELQKEGLLAMSDRGGKTWSLNRYGTMLARTVLTKAHTQGTINQMSDNGYHLVEVSDHGGECALCRPWENEILSVNDNINAPYTSLSTAKAEGLYHPNCRHTIVPYTEISKENDGGLVWDSNEEKYRPWRRVHPQNYTRARKRDVKDVMKAHDRITSQIGIRKYKELNNFFQDGKKQAIRDFADKQSERTKKRIKRLLFYM